MKKRKLQEDYYIDKREVKKKIEQEQNAKAHREVFFGDYEDQIV